VKLWVATQNKHKIDEIIKIMGEKYSIFSLLDLKDYHQIDETGKTFRENASLKAKSLWERVREPVFADDSGLEVDVLDGRPGIHSMRYSEPNPTYEKNILKLLKELEGIPQPNRTARFRCSISFLDQKGEEWFFDGVVEGYIGFEKRGTGGFGFDPVFYLPDRGCSMAELPQAEKNKISHRGKALEKLKEFLESRRHH